MSNEPVLTAITALVVAAFGVLVAFGVDFTPEQVAASVAFVAAVYGVGVLVRSKVTPNRG